MRRQHAFPAAVPEPLSDEVLNGWHQRMGGDALPGGRHAGEAGGVALRAPQRLRGRRIDVDGGGDASRIAVDGGAGEGRLVARKDLEAGDRGKLGGKGEVARTVLGAADALGEGLGQARDERRFEAYAGQLREIVEIDRDRRVAATSSEKKANSPWSVTDL
jgi:hypothetical protein